MRKRKLLRSKLLDSVLAIIYESIYSIKNNTLVIDYVNTVIWRHIDEATTKRGKIVLFRISQFLRAVKKEESDGSGPSVAHQVLYHYQMGSTSTKYAHELNNIGKALDMAPTIKHNTQNLPTQIEHSTEIEV